MSESLVASLSCPYWIFGLPVDCLSLDEARQLVLYAARTCTRLVFATPNADFLAESGADPAFRQALLDCDMSLVDGTPVFWLGRAIGVPLPMRVTGSSLLEGLVSHPGDPAIRMFFFGGDRDASMRAADALRSTPAGAVAAGWLDPGFVSIEEMSTPDVLDRINAARPDFLVVALGAKKGHEWIARNAGELDVPVISHLGAAIGFIAGTKRRAPRLLQRTGFEWLWRMVTEPRLVRRYAGDLRFLGRAVASGLLPLLFCRMIERNKVPSLSLVEVRSGERRTLLLSGQLVGSTLAVLASKLQQVLPDDVVLDVSGLTDVDSRALGQLYHLKYRNRSGTVELVCQPDARITRRLRFHRATALFSMSVATS